MEKQKKIPHIVKIGAWILCLIVFAVGFWHTHLGLKEMRPFGSEYGSIAIAAIVLLLLLITYYFAVSGNKTALIFYIFCGLFFFTFNMNYFYPSYLGRQLVKEEATLLNDTLQHYANKGQTLSYQNGFKNTDGSLQDYLRLQKLRDLIVDEIKDLHGVGPNSIKYLQEFNVILKKYNTSKGISLSIDPRSSDIEKANFYKNHLTAEINSLLIDISQKGSNLSNVVGFFTGIGLLDSLQKFYTPILNNDIIPDNSEVKLETIKNNTQINTLQNLVSGLDEAVSKINEASKKSIFTKLGEAKTRNLGRIAHTVSSVKERINKIDTWAIIFICLFIDLLVPLAIYLLLERKDVKDDETTKILGPNTF